jgi:Flp pilus assembly protein TadG
MFHRCARRERGAAAVEMALILPVLLLLVGGIIDMGRAFMTQIVLTNAAREGTRAAVVMTTGTPGAAIRARAVAGATGTDTPTATVVPANGCVGATATTQVVVTITASFNWTFMDALPGTLPPSMTAQSVVGCK